MVRICSEWLDSPPFTQKTLFDSGPGHSRFVSIFSSLLPQNGTDLEVSTGFLSFQHRFKPTHPKVGA
jgi:hypothetical protein